MTFPSHLIRKDLVTFKAYSSARHLAQEGSIFLDANENPYDPSGGEDWNRYPEPQPKELVKALAQLYSCTSEQLIVSRGSDEAIDILIRGFCTPGTDEIIVSPPTYGVYDFYAKLQGAKIKQVPLLAESFDFDCEAIKQAATSKTKLLFLCSPNNPTGNLLSPSGLIDILQATKDQTLVIVDEAYIEFSDADSAIQLINQFPHLAVLRTLSKAWGLAGLRCGSLVGNPELISFLKKIIAPYPLARPVYEAALKTLGRGRPESLDLLVIEREKMVASLSECRSVTRVFPSSGNFILVKFDKAISLFEHLKAKGIILRSRATEEATRDCLRLTIGQPEENELLLQEIRKWEQNHA